MAPAGWWDRATGSREWPRVLHSAQAWRQPRVPSRLSHSSEVGIGFRGVKDTFWGTLEVTGGPSMGSVFPAMPRVKVRFPLAGLLLLAASFLVPRPVALEWDGGLQVTHSQPRGFLWFRSRPRCCLPRVHSNRLAFLPPPGLPIQVDFSR